MVYMCIHCQITFEWWYCTDKIRTNRCKCGHSPSQ